MSTLCLGREERLGRSCCLPSGSRGPSVPDDSWAHTGMLLSLTLFFPGKEIATIFASLLLSSGRQQSICIVILTFLIISSVNGYYHIDGKSLFIGGHRWLLKTGKQ